MDVQPAHLANKSKFQSLDYYRCPICVFKHRSRLVMKKHLNTHYHGNQLKQNPVYQCNICAYKSEWQYAVKKHIIKSHLTNENAACVKLIAGLEQHQHQQQRHANKPSSSGKKLKINFKFSNARFRPSTATEYRSDSDQTESNSHSNPYFRNAYNEPDEDDDDDVDQFDNNYENGDDTAADNTNTYESQQSPYKQQGLMNYSLDCTQDDSVKVVETIMLTDYDGVEFPSSYLVSGGSNSLNNKYNVNSTVIGGPLNGANSQPQKKMFFCQACPYNTKNYCNLKQHLLQHRFREGYFKCRYCAYFVSMIRLLKQHEILHSDYVPRENIKAQKSTSSFSFPK